jgi:DNA-binding FrmR family transcriptional regulator
MSHIVRDREKLNDRVRPHAGQGGVVEKALDQEHDCSKILRTIAASRGAVDTLIADVLEGHIRLRLTPTAAHLAESKGYQL